jgi:hypothetical protein
MKTVKMNGGNLVVLLCGMAALLSSIVSNFWCRTISFKPAEFYGVPNGLPDISYGIWTRREVEFYSTSDGEEDEGDQTSIYSKNTCKQYSSSVYIDPAWQFARAFSIIAPTSGAFLVSSAIFGSNNTMRWRAVAVLLMTFVTLCQGLTLLLFRSNACSNIPLIDEVQSNQVWSYLVSLAYPGPCQFDSGSFATIVATLLWFVTGLFMIILGSPKLHEDRIVADYKNYTEDDKDMS